MERANILYVDDSVVNLKYFKEIFRAEHHVFTATSASQGFEILEKEEIHVIIADLKMPFMSGIEFLNELYRKKPSIPRILLTAYGDAQNIRQAINEAKIFHFAQKPWKKADLELVIENALSKYSLDIANRQLLEELSEKSARLESELGKKEELLEQIKKSEEHLKSNQKYLQNVINTAGSIIIVLANDGAVVEWNVEAEKYFGYTKMETFSRSFFDKILGVNDRGFYKEQYSKLNSKDQSISFEGNLISKSGKFHSFLWTLSALTDPKGKQAGTIFVGQNIDELQRSEKERKQSERLYKLLAENTNDVIWTLSKDLKVLYVSPAIQRLCGYLPTEFSGLTLEKIFQKESFLYLNRIFNKFFEELANGHKDQHTDTFNLEHLKKDGSVVWTEITLNKVYEDGTFLFFLMASRDITERVQTERKLRISEEKFSTIFRSSPDAIILTSLDTNEIMDLNDRAMMLAGYSRMEMLGKSMLDMRLWNDKQQRARYFKELGETGKSLNVEAEFITKSGKKRTALITGEVLSLQEGDFIMNIIRDITLKKIEEKRLRISEEKYFTLFNSSPDMILLTKMQTGEILEANNQIAEALGTSKLEILGKTTVEVGFWLSPESREQFTDELRNKGYTKNYEVPIISYGPGRTIGLISSQIVSLQNELCILAIIRDITQRKEWEEKLRVNEERFRTIFENAVVGYYRTTPEGKILMANPTLVKMLEYENESELKKLDLSSNNFAKINSRKTLLEKIKTKGQVVDFETVWYKKNGAPIHVSESAREIRDKDGQLIHLDGTVIDISLRKEMEESLRKSEAMFKGITEQTTQGIVIAGLNGNFIYVNNSFTRMTGMGLVELVGRKIQDFIVDSRSEENIFAQLKETGECEQELQLYKADRSKFFVEIVANRIQIGNDKLMLGLFTDITGRVESEKALRRSESRLREAQKLAHIGNWIFDHKLGVIDWSEEVYRIFGVDSKKFTPTVENINSFLHPDEPAIVKSFFYLVGSDKGKDVQIFRIKRKDGAVKYLKGLGRTTYGPNGKPRKSMGTLQDITDIKQAEEEIRKLNEGLEIKVEERTREFQESEKKFRELLRFIPDGIILVNKKGEIKLINDQTEKIFGYSRKELIDKPIDQLIPQRFVKKHGGHLSKYMENPEEKEMGAELDVFGVQKNGAEFPVDIRLGAVMLDNELHVISIIRDITIRKENENELRKLSQSLEQHPGAVIITDNEGIVEYVNPKFTEISGYTRSEMIGKNPDFLNADEETVGGNMEMWVTIMGKKIWNGDFKNMKKSGEIYWMRASVAPILNEKGDITNFVSVQYDITKTRKNEELLKFTNYSFDNAADAAYWLESETGVFVHANKIGCSRLGYSLDEFVGLNVQKIDTLLNSDEDWTEFKDILLERGEVKFESAHITKDGSTFPVQIIASTIEYENKFYFIAFVRDITEIKRAHKELERAKVAAESANRTKSEFLANMSHEIRTPMNAVLGITDLLFQQITDDVQRSYLKTIRSSGRSLLGIINDILDISKIEAGKFEIVSSFFDLRNSVKELENMFMFRAKEKGISFTVTIADSVPETMSLDELRIKQVLTNLLSNALKFTEEGYVKVRIDILREIKPDDEYCDLIIQVEDSGIGVEESFITNVFDPFSQQDGQDSKKYGGSGLGLAISLKLVELMKGNISMESKKGVGSLFTIKLYCVEFSNQKRKTTTANLGARFDKRDFLPSIVVVADDIEENRRYLQGAFQGTQTEVFLAKNGKEAYDLVLQHKPDLLITDIVMPVMDGFELTDKIRATPDVSNTNILANSAAVLSIDRKKIEQAAFDDFVPKPIPLDKFYTYMTKYLPCRKVDKEDVEENKDVRVELSEKVKKALTVKADGLWEQLQQQQKMKQVEEFHAELTRIGNEFEAPVLIEYSNKLNAAVKAFDIATILVLLKRYKEINK